MRTAKWAGHTGKTCDDTGARNARSLFADRRRVALSCRRITELTPPLIFRLSALRNKRIRT